MARAGGFGSGEGVTAAGQGHQATGAVGPRASACHAAPRMVTVMSRGTGRPCSRSFGDGAMGTKQGWGTAAPRLTLVLHAARRQDQVIDGHGPCATGHPLDQHLQGSTAPATSTQGLAQRRGDGRCCRAGGTLRSRGMGLPSSCDRTTCTSPRKGLSGSRGDAVAGRGVQGGAGRATVGLR